MHRAVPPLRLVLDTNVWLDLLLFEDPRCAALRDGLRQRRYVALSNGACRAEWLRVLAYPGLGLDAASALRLCEDFDFIAIPVEVQARARPWPALPRCRDPDDQKFLELAQAAGADWLLTRDNALLRLANRCDRDGLFGIARPEAVVSRGGRVWSRPGHLART